MIGFPDTCCTFTRKSNEQRISPELAEYRKELETFTARIEALDAKRRSAQQRRAPVDELNSITRERSELRRPSSLFVRSRSGQSIIQLYDVVHVGDDYIEFAWLREPGRCVVGSTVTSMPSYYDVFR